jgi:hypothetical protein
LYDLNKQEVVRLKSHFATSSWGGRRKSPLPFTEHGAIMVATILNSPRAVQMSVYIAGSRSSAATNRVYWGIIDLQIHAKIFGAMGRVAKGLFLGS